MSSNEPRDESNRQMDLIKSVWQRIRTCLEIKKQQIYEEIKNYPHPIPACDQQFNFLLEQRARLSRELARMDETLTDSGTDCIAMIKEMIQSSSFIDDATAQTIRSSLKEGLGRTEQEENRVGNE